MGGLSGHMMHPYDNYDMTKDELLTLVSSATRLPMTEKIDGFGFHACYVQGKWRIARSKSDLIKGGIARNELNERFAHNPKAAYLYAMALNILNSMDMTGCYIDWIPCLKDHYTINCEIITNGSANTIPYQRNVVFTHNVWHWSGDWDSHEVITDHEFTHWIGVDRMDIKSCNPVFFRRPFYAGEAETEACRYINDLMGDTSTIREHYQRQFIEIIVKQYPNHTPRGYQMLYNRIMGDAKVSLKELREEWGTDDLDNILNRSTEFKRAIQANLREIIEEYGRYILRHCTNYINEHTNACRAILDALDMQPSEGPMYHIERFYKHDCEVFGLEGIVVKFGGNLYKFTGTFGIVNSLMHNGH